MLRSQNPVNGAFTTTDVVFLLDSHTTTDEFLEAVKAPELQLIECRTPFSSTVGFSTAHSQLDGFGGLRLLSDVIKQGGVSGDSAKHAFDFELDKFRVAHQIIANGAKGDFGATMNAFFEIHPPLIDENIGIPVAIESVKDFPVEDIWGNSIVVVRCTGREVLSAIESGLGKYLRRKAERILKIARKATGVPTIDSITVSWFGDLDKIPWIPPISPYSFIMLSTPFKEGIANVVFWSKSDTTAFTCIAEPKHWIWDKYDSLRKRLEGK
jgi:hypothetical protein